MTWVRLGLALALIGPGMGAVVAPALAQSIPGQGGETPADVRQRAEEELDGVRRSSAGKLVVKGPGVIQPGGQGQFQVATPDGDTPAGIEWSLHGNNQDCAAINSNGLLVVAGQPDCATVTVQALHEGALTTAHVVVDGQQPIAPNQTITRQITVYLGAVVGRNNTAHVGVDLGQELLVSYNRGRSNPDFHLCQGQDTSNACAEPTSVFRLASPGRAQSLIDQYGCIENATVVSKEPWDPSNQPGGMGAYERLVVTPPATLSSPDPEEEIVWNFHNAWNYTLVLGSSSGSLDTAPSCNNSNKARFQIPNYDVCNKDIGSGGLSDPCNNKAVNRGVKFTLELTFET